MIKLGVNVDHIATIRQSRHTTYPSPCEAARLAIAGGADQITIHLREDRRHIQESDLWELKENINVPLNLEMAVAEDILEIALRLKPNRATIVPEKREELTTEGGLDVISGEKRIGEVTKKLKNVGVLVSLFIEPDNDQLVCSKEIGAEMVEFHTGKFCDLSGDEALVELDRLASAGVMAEKKGLIVAAGHGLNYNNTKILCDAMQTVEELNIGHSIVARSFMVGMEKAVKEMKDIMGVK